MSIPTDAISTADIGAYAFDKFSYSSWNKFEFTKFSGSPINGSTIKSLVIL